jgi:2-phosphosulfolactate phosphatase
MENPTRKIEVCLSPDLLHVYDLKGKIAIVVDILRATSSMVTAFAHGISKIKPVSSVDECKKFKSNGYMAAAERDGMTVEGFDFGNSPFSYMDEKVKGKLLAFTTTNGTLAIERSKNADELIIGSFLNLQAIIDYITAKNNDVIIVCAGWKGDFNLEDTLFAGALVEETWGKYKVERDSSLAARILYNEAKSDLFGFLKQSSHFNRLNHLNIFRDVEHCLTLNVYNVLPMFDNGFITINSKS